MTSCAGCCACRPPTGSSPSATRSGPGSRPSRSSALTRIDPWFLENMREIVAVEREIARGGARPTPSVLRRAKQLGFADRRIAELTGATEAGVRARAPRARASARRSRRSTPAPPSSWRTRRTSTRPTRRRTRRRRPRAEGHHPRRRPEPHRPGDRVRLLLRPRGVRAARGRRRDDHGQLQPGDGLDRLRHVRPALLRAAHARGRARHRRARAAARRDRAVRRPDAAEARGAAARRRACRSSAPSPDAIDRAEDRERFGALLAELGLNQAAGATARSLAEAQAIAATIGYPVLVRPSYVLGGRAMEIVYDDAGPRASSWREAVQRLARAPGPHRPVPRGRDRGRRRRGRRRRRACVIGGVMEHIEEAGIHSGDSACALPPYSLGEDADREILRAQTRALARGPRRGRAS